MRSTTHHYLDQIKYSNFALYSLAILWPICCWNAKSYITHSVQVWLRWFLVWLHKHHSYDCFVKQLKFHFVKCRLTCSQTRTHTHQVIIICNQLACSKARNILKFEKKKKKLQKITKRDQFENFCSFQPYPPRDLRHASSVRAANNMCA